MYMNFIANSSYFFIGFSILVHPIFMGDIGMFYIQIFKIKPEEVVYLDYILFELHAFNNSFASFLTVL